MILNKISNKDLVEFNKTFSLMLMSKLSIVQSLELNFNQTKNSNLKSTIKRIIKDVKSGNSLFNSFKKYPAIFSEIYLANLKVAEESSQVAEVLTEYTEYLENSENLKRKIIQASRYPLLVLFITAGVVSFMVFFLIPTFEGLFLSSKLTLPILTQIIIQLSNIVKENILIIVIIFFSLILLIIKSKRTAKFKYIIDNILLHLPLFSKLYKANLLARFSLCMAILLKSKITLIEALKIGKNISGNLIFKQEVESIIKRLTRGESFSVNISKSKLFDVTFSRLLTVGEESSELEKVFTLISNYYSKDFNYQIDGLISLIEPFLILLVGFIVAIVLVAMYLPMFELINNFGV
jgi:type IV pilus assembly protein PilC